MIVEAEPIADLFGDGFFVVQVAQNTNKTWVGRYCVVSFTCEPLLILESPLRARLFIPYCCCFTAASVVSIVATYARTFSHICLEPSQHSILPRDRAASDWERATSAPDRARYVLGT